MKNCSFQGRAVSMGEKIDPKNIDLQFLDLMHPGSISISHDNLIFFKKVKHLFLTISKNILKAIAQNL